MGCSNWESWESRRQKRESAANEPAAMASGSLRISRFERSCCVLGPGCRAVVWFQGCSLACKGCIASSMNAAPPLLLTSPRALADWILSTGADGLTLSGGDPFDQPLDALAELLEIVRSESPMDTMVYTGRTLAQLQRFKDPDVSRCLRSIDILVDGPYVEALNDGVGWRGSTNQVVHVMGSRSHGVETAAAAPRRLELRVAPDGIVTFTGLPVRHRGRDLAARLELAAGPWAVAHPVRDERLQ